MVGECLNVLPALSERRELDWDHVEPVIEILPERSFLDRTFQVAVGGSNHPHIDGDWRDTAHAFEFPLLEESQELGLELASKIADLVEEDGSSVGHFEPSSLAPVCAREGTLLMSEQLALQELARQPHRVDRDERLIPSLAPVVDGAREDLLSCPALAQKQDGRRAAGRPMRQLGRTFHGRALAHDQMIALPHLLREDLDLPFEAPPLQTLLHD